MDKPEKTIGSVHRPFSLQSNPEYVERQDKQIAELKAERADLVKLILKADNLLMTGRRLSSTPTNVLNWTMKVRKVFENIKE